MAVQSQPPSLLLHCGGQHGAPVGIGQRLGTHVGVQQSANCSILTSECSILTSECRALWGERERGHAVEIGI